MSGIRNSLFFVGKSAAFAVIAGLIWCIMILVVSNIGARSQSNKSELRNTTLAEQIETYNKQMDAAHAQMIRSEELQSRTEKILEADERLNAEQERLQKRFSAILDKWEKAPAR